MNDIEDTKIFKTAKVLYEAAVAEYKMTPKWSDEDSAVWAHYMKFANRVVFPETYEND